MTCQHHLFAETHKTKQINKLFSYQIHHKSQYLRVYGFEYQFFKCIRKYLLASDLYLRPCPAGKLRLYLHPLDSVSVGM